jgi:hypothetical protein
MVYGTLFAMSALALAQEVGAMYRSSRHCLIPPFEALVGRDGLPPTRTV